MGVIYPADAPLMLGRISVLLDNLDQVLGLGKPIDGLWIEHAIECAALGHQVWVTLPPATVHPRAVVFHPSACRCDALPLEVLLHG